MPISYLVLEQVPATEVFVSQTIGPYIWGIITYVGAAVGMVVGSLVKPALEEDK